MEVTDEKTENKATKEEPKAGTKFFIENAFDTLAELLKNWNNRPKPTKFQLLESMNIGGLCLIGGIPQVGKTWLICQMILHDIKEGKPVIIFSFEMPKVEIVKRLYITASQMNEDKFGVYKKSKADFITEIGNLLHLRDITDFFAPDKNDNISIKPMNYKELSNEINSYFPNDKPNIYIDSFHEIPTPDKGDNQKAAIDYNVLNLRMLVDNTGVNVFCVAQANRAAMDKGGKIGLHSFSGSASLEYTIDSAIALNGYTDTEDYFVIDLLKNRYFHQAVKEIVIKKDKVLFSISSKEAFNDEDESSKNATNSKTKNKGNRRTKRPE